MAALAFACACPAVASQHAGAERATHDDHHSHALARRVSQGSTAMPNIAPLLSVTVPISVKLGYEYSAAYVIDV